MLHNAVLTSDEGQTGSHEGKDWEGLTVAIVQDKGKLVDVRRHCAPRTLRLCRCTG